MRHLTLILAAGVLAAAPAAAQNAEVPSGIAGPDANMAMNATDAATVNGLAGDANMAMPLPSPVLEDPAVTDATVTPETGEDDGGFPWGVLGLLGLVGLIGRFRS